AKGKIKPCLQEYTLAVLPVVNLSGLGQRTLEAVSNAIKDELKKKYPPKKTKVRFIANDAINEVMAVQPFENSEAPTLKELVDVGNSLGADRVMFISLMSSNDKESGFMVIVGAGTIRANVTMKQKLVDVNKGTFIYNANTVSKGASNSVNFWRIGSPSKIRAVKKSVANAMKQFLMSFDQDGD
ncbi:MAG: hypothetical protein KBS60_04665, partial [Phascolarctobacterium sp.]|nr:hypothetical protein [Candidatus Phascolarctobacterium caballi]